MSQPETDQGAEITGSELPPWQETVLARYPRSLKVTVFFVLLLLAVSPVFIKAFSTAEQETKKTLKTITTVQGEETQAAIPNPKLAAGDHAAASVAVQGADVSNDQDDHSVKLITAPDINVTEDTAEGSLPRISDEGRQPWQVYGRPFNLADRRPRIAIVITDLGMSRINADAAINRMPTNVTLAFDVQSPVVGAWCARARQQGHETLLSVPMEPFDYPRSDPGPGTLLTSLPNADNLGRLLTALRRSTGYVGVTTISGSRFTTDPNKLTPILESLGRRGLIIFDARVAPHSAIIDLARTAHVMAAASSQKLDQNLSPEAIDASLNQLEQTARLKGSAVGVTSAEPIMLDHLQAWMKTLPERGIALAPISAMVQ